MKWPTLIPPVGEPILRRQARGSRAFDWTFEGAYQPIFVDSGTNALRLAIAAASLATGNQGPVWLPAYGCPDLLAACLAAGREPSLYDVGPDTPFYSDNIAAPATVSCAVACHFLGLKAPLDPIRRALGHGSVVIEDSAQYFPSSPTERFRGDLVVLSFGRGKPVSLLEGGCLLTRPELAREVREIASEWPQVAPSRWGHAKRTLHDLAIRPGVYSLLSRVPGLHPGFVKYRPAPVPRCMEYRFQSLATVAASGYQAESEWIDRQRILQSEIADFLPEVTDIWGTCDPSGISRLLRYPVLTDGADSSEHLVRLLRRRGACATRMYRSALPGIPDIPIGLSSAPRSASQFAERCVTIPIGTHLPLT